MFGGVSFCLDIPTLSLSKVDTRLRDRHCLTWGDDLRLYRYVCQYRTVVIDNEGPHPLFEQYLSMVHNRDRKY